MRAVIKKASSALISDAIAAGAEELTAAGVAEPRREAGSLLAHLLGRDRTFIIAHANDSLTPAQKDSFKSLIQRRAAGEPTQYITGRQEFFKLSFEVTPDVLIPRPETELIVETALELLRINSAPSFADLGTGSGCIAISLLHELPAARAVALDKSSPALRVARRNAARHQVENRIDLIESDLFSALAPGTSFDLIVSNPPYVTDDELAAIQREVSFEPPSALAAGPDGLALISRLLREAKPFLRPDGHLVFEIGFGQSEGVRSLIDQRIWKLLDVRADLQGIPRTFVLKRIKSN